MQKLITRGEFAALAAINPGLVTRLCKKRLNDAVVGDRIDANHPDVADYLQERTERAEAARGFGTTRGRRKPVTPKPNKTDGPQITVGPHAPDDMPLDVPNDVTDFMDMTLGEIVTRFGTSTRFVDWLNATQRIEMITEKRLKNAKIEGDLVSRDLVKRGVIEPFNNLHIRLLTDGAVGIASGVVAKHAAGDDMKQLEIYVSDVISSFISPVKKMVSDALNDAA